MMMRSLVLLAFVSSATSFTGNTPVFHRTSSSSSQQQQCRSRSTVLMGGGTGYATSIEGKKEKVSNINSLLSKSEMIFTIPASSLTVAQTQGIRNSLPEGTTMSVVKNKLMARALEGTEYEAASELLKGANMWFFIEEDIGATIKALKAFNKENGLLDSHSILAGAIDGGVVTPQQVEAIGKLPSKQELIAKIAGGIKAVPTKVARVIKAPNAKLARAIKLATEEDKSDT